MDRVQFMVVVLGEFLFPSIYINISGLMPDFEPEGSGREVLFLEIKLIRA
jgi:hypothetical protein